MSGERRIKNGPNTLCTVCERVANHASGRCAKCRGDWQPMTAADETYLAWKRARDQDHDPREPTT